MFALTPRLTLRPGWPEDASELTRAIGHESVVTKLSRVPWPYRDEHAREFLYRPRGAAEPLFMITERGGDRLVGGIGLHADNGDHELGYWLTPDAWGRGYATEAGHAVVAIARETLRLPRLRSSYLVGNQASGRVLTKLGFGPTGRMIRMTSRALGREVDAVEMALDLDKARTGPGPMPLAA